MTKLVNDDDLLDIPAITQEDVKRILEEANERAKVAKEEARKKEHARLHDPVGICVVCL